MTRTIEATAFTVLRLPGNPGVSFTCQPAYGFDGYTIHVYGKGDSETSAQQALERGLDQLRSAIRDA